MHTDPSTFMKDYADPREQAVQVRDYPDPPIRLMPRPVVPERAYPETAASVMDAYLHNCVERAEAGVPPLPAPRLSEYERLDSHDAIRRMAERVGGWARLYAMVRNLAHIDGDEV